jgi:hypothetical protein
MAMRRRWLGLLLAGVCVALPVAADEPARTQAELAVSPLVEVVKARRTLRGDGGLHDVWLVSDGDFDHLAERARTWVSARKALDGGMRLERFTFLEPDRSYVLELAGGGRSWKLRLSRHLQGSLLELPGLGAAADAPRWAPPWRPEPPLLFHGPLR